MDSLNWGQKMVHANSEEVESKQKIKVALIDSGVNYSTDIDVVERKNFIQGMRIFRLYMKIYQVMELILQV